MPSPPTRRQVVAGLGAGIGASLAGCSAVDSVRYIFQSRPENGTDSVDLFTWQPASNAFHYQDEGYVATLADELRETGTVRSIEIPLVEERGTGEDGYVPSYTRHDGTYYRVRVRAESVALERWVVWMEPLDELPAGVEHTTEPAAGLSEFDTRILRRARHEAVGSAIADRDHAARRAYKRGVVFFEPLDPDESELVPDPPFDYAVVEPDSHLGPDELPIRLHVSEEVVETTRYTHELDPVATTRDELEAHLRSEHIVARYSSEELPEAARRVLTESTRVAGYDEEVPLSEAFERTLADLDLAEVSLPAGRDVASWRRYYEYDDACYAARLHVSDNSLLEIG